MNENSRDLPQTGLAGLRQHWRSDVVSGFLVFLIALPLCLGIAMASGFPPMAGIITAVIGGLLVSRINGSFLTINGPAAGLIVVILDAVRELGQGDALAGYRNTLAAIVCASVLQILLGVLKAGKLSAFFPSSVVHGMLAAIGIIIMAKQIHTLLGVKPEISTLFQTLGQIPHSFVEMNPEVAVIGSLGLGLMIAWSFLNNRYLKMIPAPLLVVLTGLMLGQYFDLEHEHIYLFLPDEPFLPHHEYTVGPRFLVSIPDNFLASFTFPDFSLIGTLRFWEQVIAICLVGSLESLLSAAAVDKLDPYKRYSDLNRDLTAVGIGNTVAGLVGGMPMIAEIVRSSANINNDAKTGWSNFFHGAFMLLFVALFPHLIHEIPLASLAALLVYTGFKLASPKEFLKTLAIGYEQLVVFVITILGVLATDLLIGVGIGMMAEFLVHVLRSVDWSKVFKLYFAIDEREPGLFCIRVDGAAFFANFLSLKSELSRLPERKALVFDLSEAETIDHTVMEFIHHYCEDYERRGGTCEIHGLDRHQPMSSHPLAARRRKRGKSAPPAGLSDRSPHSTPIWYDGSLSRSVAGAAGSALAKDLLPALPEEHPLTQNPSPAPKMSGSTEHDRLFIDAATAKADFKFDEKTAAVFDDMIARSVPFYDEMQRMTGEIAADFAQPGTSLYDLGCATATSLVRLDPLISPEVRFVGIDDSAEMLAKAHEKLAACPSGRAFDLRLADLHTTPVVENASVVIMNLTLQFIRPLYRERVIQRIFEGMNKQGCLILIEKLIFNDGLFNRLFIRYYYEMKRRQGYSESEIAHKREALENVLIPYRPEENRELLANAGFKHIEEFFRWYNFCGMVAVK